MRAGWLLGVAAVALLANSALAGTRIIHRSGVWSAFAGTAQDGEPVCGVSTTSTDGTRFLGVKYFGGTQHLTVHIMKDTWAIPQGTPVQLEVQFAGEAPWTARGMGDGRIVQFMVGDDDVEAFVREFRAAPSAAIRFPSGNEAGWSINLSGSGAATSAMIGCMDALVNGRRAPSQPFSGAPAAPSQPFAPSGPSTGRPSPGPASPVGPARNT